MHFKGFRIDCRGKDTGEGLFLRLNDSKSLVILGHPAEDFPRTNFRVKQEKFSKSAAKHRGSEGRGGGDGAKQEKKAGARSHDLPVFLAYQILPDPEFFQKTEELKC